jgi:hypothetical protein
MSEVHRVIRDDAMLCQAGRQCVGQFPFILYQQEPHRSSIHFIWVIFVQKIAAALRGEKISTGNAAAIVEPQRSKQLNCNKFNGRPVGVVLLILRNRLRGYKLDESSGLDGVIHEGLR